MKHGFVAWTPLHVINMLNVQANYISKNDKIVFFVYDNFMNSSKLIAALSDFFPHIEVIIINPEEFGNKIKKIGRLYSNHNPFYKDTVDELYIPGDNYFGRIIFSSQYKRNKNLKLNYVEDGLGVYVGVDIIHQRNMNDRFQKLFNKNSIYHGEWKNAFVYEPSLLPKQVAKNTKKLPKLDEHNIVFSQMLDLFKETYDEIGNEIKNKSIVFFDQPFIDGPTKINEIEVFKDLKALADDLNFDIQIKLHPRSNKYKYGKDVYFLETSMPWEVYLLFNDIKDFVLIGINTTAIFSPYLMFDERVPGIVLTQYVSENFADHSDLFTSNSMKKSIEITNRIKMEFGDLLKMPKSRSELKDILSKVE